ncbi:hypothetical protein [Cellulomonas sp. KRMCY2]|uniref:hypothetical protein n=1 Tax=Cellulomonas sp. KRMCY2 TaxID=1304865 RepID=UPI00045E93FB|nr:hypothetical protein [Cellulomonas sp. KRMCY2]
MSTSQGADATPTLTTAGSTGRQRPRLIGALMLVPTVIILVGHEAHWTFIRMMRDLDVRTLESAADNAALRDARRQIVETTDAVTLTALVLAVLVTASGWLAGRRRYWTYPLFVTAVAVVAIWFLNAQAVELLHSFRR